KFFFSSRRRHTRFSRDWSSDVCSSDLGDEVLLVVLPGVSDVSLVCLGRRAHHDSFRIVGAPTLGRRGPTTQVGSPDQRAGGKPRRVRNPFTDCATKSMTADATARVVRRAKITSTTLAATMPQVNACSDMTLGSRLDSVLSTTTVIGSLPGTGAGIAVGTT